MLECPTNALTGKWKLIEAFLIYPRIYQLVKATI